ncbi:uncharacterized protein LOC131078452 isoform X1 [Cryptomeria japonica]|uniref:uncharacterized protein LOC131078452 isoform X1 n=1 Tax=Cryptomeria japonica TaxID=3369 RepID=UPI0025AD348B|nr:uncharacterized protein LOC131078452 isoform X1 [Cryptomeria japonica]
MEEANPNPLNNLTPKPTKAVTPPAGGGASASPIAASATARKRRKTGTPESVYFYDSKYAKIRTTLRELRPVFIEILKTPDYRSSRHALEVCKGMRQMMELCKQLRTETCMLGKNKRSDCTPAAGESVDNQSNKRQKEETSQETFLVGGSPIGWNFIWFFKRETKSTATL